MISSQVVISKSVILEYPSYSYRYIQINEDRPIHQASNRVPIPVPICVACLIIVGFALFSTVYADSLEMPTDIGAPKNRINVKMPPRGTTMQQVIEQFGEPTTNHNPVGDPPITRWVYPKFTVHFESEFVIHSVIKK